MRLVIAECSVDYSGRLNAHLPRATRLLMFKNDGSVLIHSDGGSYKPLNWMSPPCTLSMLALDEAQTTAGIREIWQVTHAKTADVLVISVYNMLHDSTHHLGKDPGLQKDAVEADLQKLLAQNVDLLGEGFTLIRREYPTPIGPVDLLVRDNDGNILAVEMKRKGDIDGVEQLSRYLDFLNRDPILAPVQGIFAAQDIKPQARTLAKDRSIRCVRLDYDAMRGLEDTKNTLF